MVVVPNSLFNLKRRRTELQKKFESRDWSAVRRIDIAVQQALEAAEADPMCDRLTLLRELERVVDLYRLVTHACRLQGIGLQNFPSK